MNLEKVREHLSDELKQIIEREKLWALSAEFARSNAKISVLLIDRRYSVLPSSERDRIFSAVFNTEKLGHSRHIGSGREKTFAGR